MNPFTLILLTSSYPNEYGETFVENEMPYLERSFKKIIIVCSSGEKVTNRYLPANAEVITYNDDIPLISKLFSFFIVFKKIFRKEKRFVKSNLNLPFTFFKFKVLSADYYKALRLKKIISKLISVYSKSDIIIYSYWNDYKALSLALLKKKNPEIKMISRIHGWDLYLERNPENYLPWKPFIHSKLDKVFFISEAGLDYAKNKLNYKKDNYFISRLGITNSNDLKEFSDYEKLVICSNSNIITLKRLDLMIDALCELEKINFEWVHIGEGPEKNNILNKIKRSNIIDKCLLVGQKTNKEVLDLYQEKQINLFINVSSSEGIPVSIMEAMSFGIPVIASCVGGITEIVLNGRNGFLLPEDPAPAEIAEAILKFNNLSVEEKNKFRYNAYATWKEKFNADKNYRMFIESVLGK